MNQTTTPAALDLDKLERYSIDCDGLPFHDSEGVWVAYEDVSTLARRSSSAAGSEK